MIFRSERRCGDASVAAPVNGPVAEHPSGVPPSAVDRVLRTLRIGRPDHDLAGDPAGDSELTANEVSERSEMEQLFIECIEEVRKEVMRRRFRNEIANQKSTATVTTNVAQIKRLGAVRLSKTSIAKNESNGQINPTIMSDSEAKDFEESLYKLA